MNQPSDRYVQPKDLMYTPPKSFPDPTALAYALSYAHASGNTDEVARLTRIQTRSVAFGNGMGTHMPLLASIVAILPPELPILELGAGNYSTPMLHMMAKMTGRQLVTIEADKSWADSFGDFRDATHAVYYIEDGYNGWLPAIDSLPTEGKPSNWGLVFVDQTPGQTRAITLRHLADRAKYLVCHDTHNSFFAGLDEALGEFKYRYDDLTACPPATAVSNSNTFEEFVR
jgi:hypothetical protein